MTHEPHRLYVDNPIALIVHHDSQKLLQPVELDAIPHRLPFVSDAQHKSNPAFECPDLSDQLFESFGHRPRRASMCNRNSTCLVQNDSLCLKTCQQMQQHETGKQG